MADFSSTKINSELAFGGQIIKGQPGWQDLEMELVSTASPQADDYTDQLLSQIFGAQRPDGRLPSRLANYLHAKLLIDVCIKRLWNFVVDGKEYNSGEELAELLLVDRPEGIEVFGKSYKTPDGKAFNHDWQDLFALFGKGFRVLGDPNFSEDEAGTEKN